MVLQSPLNHLHLLQWSPSKQVHRSADLYTAPLDRTAEVGPEGAVWRNSETREMAEYQDTDDVDGQIV